MSAAVATRAGLVIATETCPAASVVVLRCDSRIQLQAVFDKCLTVNEILHGLHVFTRPGRVFYGRT